MPRSRRLFCNVSPRNGSGVSHPTSRGEGARYGKCGHRDRHHGETDSKSRHPYLLLETSSPAERLRPAAATPTCLLRLDLRRVDRYDPFLLRRAKGLRRSDQTVPRLPETHRNVARNLCRSHAKATTSARCVALIRPARSASRFPNGTMSSCRGPPGRSSVSCLGNCIGTPGGRARPAPMTSVQAIVTSLPANRKATSSSSPDTSTGPCAARMCTCTSLSVLMLVRDYGLRSYGYCVSVSPPSSVTRSRSSNRTSPTSRTHRPGSIAMTSPATSGS